MLLFAISCQIARVMRYLPGLDINYEKDLGIVLTDSNATLGGADCNSFIISVIPICRAEARVFD